MTDCCMGAVLVASRYAGADSTPGTAACQTPWATLAVLVLLCRYILRRPHTVARFV